MSISEVYALNIMPNQIVRYIGCLPTDKEQIEDCRKDFLNFLLDRETQGVIYYSQLTAWHQYVEWESVYEHIETEKEFDHLDVDRSQEVEDLSWSEELELLAYMKANTIEFLGNYDFESTKGNSYPSQQ